MSDKLMLEICRELGYDYLSDLRIHPKQVLQYLMYHQIDDYDLEELESLSEYVFQTNYKQLMKRIDKYKQNNGKQ